MGEYNLNEKCKILIVFYDMMAHMPSNKKLNPIVTTLFTRCRKLSILIDNKIRDKNLQDDINREVEKIRTLSFGKIDKYEYLTGEELLPSGQRRVVEQDTCTYSSLRKALEKQTKTIDSQGKKQIKATEDHGKQLVESNGLVKKWL